MDKGFAGQVGHARGHLATVAQEGVAINSGVPSLFRRPHVKEMVSQITFAQ